MFRGGANFEEEMTECICTPETDTNFFKINIKTRSQSNKVEMTFTIAYTCDQRAI